MSEKIKTALSIVLILLILPYIITYAWQGSAYFEKSVKYDEGKNDASIHAEERIEPTEILIGILAGQIGMDAPEEVLRAQAVLVRTEYYRREENEEEQEQSLTMDELLNLWGSHELQKNYELAKKAVCDTAGEVLTAQDALIMGIYHKVSAGATRAAQQVNGIEASYLQSVTCPSDILSKDYLSVRFFSKDEFRENLGLRSTEEDIIFSIDADEIGYVQSMDIKDGETDISYSGDEIRARFELPSPCFYIKEVEGQMRIVNKGKGHGYGMSQHAACILAKEGKTYQEILEYFFPDTQLKKI